jgi:hypothetical protein
VNHGSRGEIHRMRLGRAAAPRGQPAVLPRNNNGAAEQTNSNATRCSAGSRISETRDTADRQENQLAEMRISRLSERLEVLINAPSSTKNAKKARDPEMHQTKTKKGNQWYFGMKGARSSVRRSHGPPQQGS